MKIKYDDLLNDNFYRSYDSIDSAIYAKLIFLSIKLSKQLNELIVTNNINALRMEPCIDMTVYPQFLSQVSNKKMSINKRFKDLSKALFSYDIYKHNISYEKAKYRINLLSINYDNVDHKYFASNSPFNLNTFIDSFNEMFRTSLLEDEMLLFKPDNESTHGSYHIRFEPETYIKPTSPNSFTTTISICVYINNHLYENFDDLYNLKQTYKLDKNDNIQEESFDKFIGPKINYKHFLNDTKKAYKKYKNILKLINNSF